MSAPSLLVTAPVLPTLLRLSAPNMVAMLATALVSVMETSYVGHLGTAALAGMALVFPLIMLQQMLSAGSVGGAISAHISRALGAGDLARAASLAWHATAMAVGLGSFFTVLMLGWGTEIFALLGGRGDAVQAAWAYAQVAFAASIGIWLINAFASICRASGDMRTPSFTLLAVAVAQVLIGGSLGLGWGPFPAWGMHGVAAGVAIAYSAGAVFLGWRLTRAHARVRVHPHALHGSTLGPMARTGALASMSSLQTVLTILIVTRIVAHWGPEALAGYGIGSRLEFLLVPITFAVGVACVPLVGMALGAGKVERARRVAWTGAALVGVVLSFAGLVAALWPDAWTLLFTQHSLVVSAAATYFKYVGPFYGLFAVGLCLYFASQGAGKLVGPVLAGSLRLVAVALGGWWLLAHDANIDAMFALIGGAMGVYGLVTMWAVWRTRWA